MVIGIRYKNLNASAVYRRGYFFASKEAAHWPTDPENQIGW